MEEKKLTDELEEMYVSGKFNGKIIFNAIKTIYALQGKNAEHKAEIERLTLAVEGLKGENKVIHKENDELLGKIERLTEELKIAERNLTAESRNYESSNHSVGLLKGENAELQKQVDELTEENGYLKQCADNFLADYQTAQKQVDDWVRVHDEQLSAMQVLTIENENLQKQVDELQDRLASVLIGIKADELLVAKGIEQAVKDTAKEILTKMLANAKRLKEQFNSTTYGINREHLIATIEIEIEGIKNLCKKHGVEVK